MPASDKYRIESRIWISTETGMYLGKGRIQLLEEINRLGSIAKAANAMEMSYKKAWKLLKSMNDASGAPLLQKTIGGAGGGGTALTKEGLKVIQAFNKLENEHQRALEKRFKKYEF